MVQEATEKSTYGPLRDKVVDTKHFQQLKKKGLVLKAVGEGKVKGGQDRVCRIETALYRRACSNIRLHNIADDLDSLSI